MMEEECKPFVSIDSVAGRLGRYKVRSYLRWVVGMLVGKVFATLRST